MNLAITTPTGNIGRTLVHLLQQRGGHKLTLLARDARKLRDEQDRGAIVREGSLLDEKYVTTAIAGSDALFFVIPPDLSVPDFRGYQNEVARSVSTAIGQNDVAHVVFVSSVGAQHESGTGPITGLHDAEKRLAATGCGVTSLRAAYFMENYIAQLEQIRDNSSVFLPVPADFSLPMIATRDIAGAAADALCDDPPAQLSVVSLAGPEDLTFSEAARRLGAGIGKDITHVQVESATTREALLAMGASAKVADTMVELYDGIVQGVVTYPAGDPVTRTTTSIDEFAREVVAPIAMVGS